MKRILFVCHGNICRSVMAEYMMKDLVERRGLSDCLEIGSAATSTEELGHDIYPPAKRTLDRYGIRYGRHSARRIAEDDYDRYDMLIGMDEYNIRNMERIFGGDPEHKISMLLDRAVADPWYTDDFETTYADLKDGIENLLNRLAKD